MPDQPRFPFTLVSTAFLRLEFRRQPVVPDALKTVWSATIRVDESKYPRFGVNILAEASTDQPFSFSVEIIGVFDIVAGMVQPDPAIIGEFLTERALFMLWPYVVQAVANASSQMGMPPVRIETPPIWQLSPSPSASPSPAPPGE